jgi:RNA recognition motif-containing protein
MVKKLFVGNLSFQSTEDEIRDLFSQHGNVLSVKLITDRDTGRPRGFGFVEMENEEADKAASALDGADFGGRNLKVNEARDREARPQNRSFGGGSGGPGGGRPRVFSNSRRG